ncbi:MAG TPA: NUDIX hydrolase N-terminal domain-containing protein [Chloroflexota bacterium]|jgi:hypothetical protein
MIERGKLASWADRLRAAAQTGHSYATNHYDRERYEQILAVAAEMVSSLTNLSPTEIQTVWARDVEGGSLVTTDEAPNADYFPRDALPLLVAHHERSIYDAFAVRSASWDGTVFD